MTTRSTRSTRSGRPARAPRLAVAASTLLGLAAIAAVLVLAGRTLPFPTDIHPVRLGAWVDEVGGPTAAFTLLRGLAVVLTLWCGAGWALGVMARLARVPGAVRLSDRLTIPVVRRLADAATGLAVVGATLSPVAVAAAPAPTVPEVSVVTMTDLGPAPAGSTTTTSTAAVASPTTTTTSPTTTTTPTLPPTTPTPMSPTSPSEQRRAVDATGPTWTIAPGDTLWHIAEASLLDELGRAPTPAETMERLDQVVAANRERLAVPGDPGLVFPGQVFLVP